MVGHCECGKELSGSVKETSFLASWVIIGFTRWAVVHVVSCGKFGSNVP